ncbi:esterase SG1-like [Eurytemora carolleeae]|uniref:esterase SG1-like n=1 Tax=Eurytemora carolleeae TaxID=1294199 RepID=UPI000C776C9F|nr:esterase SG1-like [Eurytemora carolleeae]|eukprot:XP_023324457.1 esterase SG1-like [Eurytemora affinis]
MLRQVLKSIFAFILNLLTMACCCCSSSPKIISKCGEIKGSRLKTNSGKNIFCFRGIPYALPPVGQLRFRRSRPYGAWTGIWDGTKESKKSLQPNVLAPDKHYLSEGDEDCLYLNVYTKTLDDTAKLPVVVFIHGGAFAVGSCESLLYGPQILLEKDIVLVGFNYRLGTLGSLTLETDECPGNLGLHDQFLALQWINENITEFGGDISNISLMGESAGSMSALLHLVSPVSQGLFHRVIALSGTPTTTFLHKDRRPRLYALAVAEKLGCEDLEDFDKVLLFLQSVPAKSILKLSTLFQDWDASHPMPWVPCLDTHAAEPMVPRGYVEAYIIIILI